MTPVLLCVNMFCTPAAHLNLGMTLSALGRHDEAEKVSTKCVHYDVVCDVHTAAGIKTLCHNQF